MDSDRRPSRVPGPDERAQSVFDYTIGVSLFLVVVLGVLLFVPTAFASFSSDTTGGATDRLTAERGVDHLTGSVMSAPDAPSTFTTGCTLLFFGAKTSNDDVAIEPGDCGIESGATLGTNLSLVEWRPANVTVERDIRGDDEREMLCWDASADEFVRVASCSAGTSGSDDIALSAGSSAVDNENFAVVERYGRFNGKGVVIVVRVW